MHFFYIDESGCSGEDLRDPQEPIFVIGGVGVKDKGWTETTRTFHKILTDYFGVPLPAGFELHAHELLSPNGDGSFLGDDRGRRNALAFALLEMIADRGHQIHFAAFDKTTLADAVAATEADEYDPLVPYLLGYDYLVTYIENFCKHDLGTSARGMIILDIKPQFQGTIEIITHRRRFEVPKARRLKWLVEFSYPVDSRRHPIIQLSDLVIFCVRKFFEMDAGHRDQWGLDAKRFYAKCFDFIYDRVRHKTCVRRDGKKYDGINEVLERALLRPSRGWRDTYRVTEN